MPSDAFPLHSMPGMPGSLDPVSPFTSSFEWANQEGGSSIPNSMTTPKGNPTVAIFFYNNTSSPQPSYQFSKGNAAVSYSSKYISNKRIDKRHCY